MIYILLFILHTVDSYQFNSTYNISNYLLVTNTNNENRTNWKIRPLKPKESGHMHPWSYRPGKVEIYDIGKYNLSVSDFLGVIVENSSEKCRKKGGNSVTRTEKINNIRNNTPLLAQFLDVSPYSEDFDLKFLGLSNTTQKPNLISFTAYNNSDATINKRNRIFEVA